MSSLVTHWKDAFHRKKSKSRPVTPPSSLSLQAVLPESAPLSQSNPNTLTIVAPLERDSAVAGAATTKPKEDILPQETAAAEPAATESPSESKAPLNARAISAPLERAPPVTSGTSTNLKDGPVDNIALALDVAEKLAGLFQTVPFIGPAAGALSQILKAHNEVKATNDKRDVLLACVTGINEELCATILHMEATNHLGLLSRLKPDVEIYARSAYSPFAACEVLFRLIRLITKAVSFVKRYDNVGTVSRVFARKQLGSDLDDLRQELDSFGARFRTNRLVDLSIQQNQMERTINQTLDTVVEEKLQKWLGPLPDMARKQDEAHNLRSEGTGGWFLNDTSFIKWQDRSGSLWIQGNSGAGKSVLSSAIVEELTKDQRLFHSSTVAFFYFDFKDKEGHAVLRALRCIVLQLSAQSPYPYKTLGREYMVSKGVKLPNYQDLLRVLEDLLRELGRTYIIIDALDECPDGEHEKLIGLILWLQNWSATPLHLLFTSQPRAFFTTAFGNVPCVIGEDIKTFIASEFQNNRKMKIWEDWADDITEKVVQKSNGMQVAPPELSQVGLLISTRLGSASLHASLRNELERALNDLPNTLFGIYDRFLEVVRHEDLVYALGVLRWLLFSVGPVDSVKQVADAVAFEFSDPAHYIYDPNLRADNEKAIVEWLEGLVTIRVDDRDQKHRLVLAHASVQEYCLSSRFTEKFGIDLSSNSSHTFIARNWHHHFLRCDHQTALFADSVRRLLENGSQQYTTFTHLRKADHFGPRWWGVVPPPLYMCSKNGYPTIARLLLESRADVNAAGGKYGHALQAASARGNNAIVQLLIAKGADVNAHGGKYASALQAAAANEHKIVVRLLIDNGADVNAQGGEYGSVLQAAVAARGSTIVHLLIEKGADVNVQGGMYGSPLQAAAAIQSKWMVQSLIAKGADVNAHGGKYGSALQAAVVNQSEAVPIVQLLIEKGADVNVQGGRYGSPLQAAAAIQSKWMVQLLIEKGADVNAHGGKYGSALQAAAANQNEAISIVQLLIEKGADVNVQGGIHGNALQAASYQGLLKIVQLLLERGANIKAEGGLHGSALQAASRRGGCVEVVQLLLEHGADVKAQGGAYGTALHAASLHGHTETVRLLLEAGADVNAPGGVAGSLPELYRGLIPEVVPFLAEAAIIANEPYGWVGSALQAAYSKGHTNIVELLQKRWRQYDKSVQRMLSTSGKKHRGREELHAADPISVDMQWRQGLDYVQRARAAAGATRSWRGRQRVHVLKEQLREVLYAQHRLEEAGLTCNVDGAPDGQDNGAGGVFQWVVSVDEEVAVGDVAHAEPTYVASKHKLSAEEDPNDEGDDESVTNHDLVGLPAICTLFCRAIEAACAWTTGVRFMLTSPIGKETVPVQLAVVDLPRQSVEACSPQDLLTRWTARTTWPDSLSDEIHGELQQLVHPKTLLQGQVHCEAGLVASLYLRQQRPQDLESPEPPVVTEAFAHLTAKMDENGQSVFAIGVAKKCCPLCAMLVGILKQPPNNFRVELAGGHSRIHPWVPPAWLPTSVLETLELALLLKIEQMVTTRAHTQSSRGSSPSSMESIMEPITRPADEESDEEVEVKGSHLFSSQTAIV
ncbi:hypothetical protein C8J57DRAFT_1210486 [Mycena rebaudengoi]|nr:hypothetical protein C8J57DRAFT_1210486 [Mycena rebaudengoi]